MSSFNYANWPPQLSNAQLEQLTAHATTYALAHGLLYLPPTPPQQQQPTVPAAAIHAPISLFPAPFPRKLFEHVQRIQHAYNVLYARIALDVEFLDKVMGAEIGVGVVDDFVGHLWRGWKKIRDDGVSRPLQLGLFRSDYLLHAVQDKQLSLKQVEFNTISSSFGPLSERTAALHRYLQSLTGYYGASPVLQPENFPPNETTAGLAAGLATAHAAYGVEGAYILFVVQPGERNAFDQRWLEYQLLEKHKIRVIRQTFDELMDSVSLDAHTKALYLSIPILSSSPLEISTVYLRAGYTPNDYPTKEHYDIRFLLERSKAINCPSIPLQLAGGKKVQEVLTQPGVLERFTSTSVISREEVDALRASWMVMWGLDINKDPVTPNIQVRGSGNEDFGVTRARKLSSSLVLKPQREGGGNNVYKEAIPDFLDKLPVKERQAWIAMELISPPESVGGYLVRSGSNGNGSQAVKADVVSELGIFGWVLFGFEEGGVKDDAIGWLVRTKGKESNEGGVATGFSVLDSVVLVD